MATDQDGEMPTRSRELNTRGQRTMARLLDAGATVFAARGFHAARVDDIVQAAEASHGTFYLYFSNKEDLFRALAAEAADDLARHAQTLGPLTPDEVGLEVIRHWIGGLCDLYRRHGPVIQAWTEAEVSGSEFNRLGADVVGSYASALATRIADVDHGNLDPQLAALALVTMAERLNYYELSGQIGLPESVAVETLAAVTFSAVFGIPAPPAVVGA
ncbi:MAG: TetR/AcrR family transcriptional regulator [Acidimicrobiia bacterium]|nr:TetR/AcrR family transcriptional regulator [Acidimicrobiia bacterium]